MRKSLLALGLATLISGCSARIEPTYEPMSHRFYEAPIVQREYRHELRNPVLTSLPSGCPLDKMANLHIRHMNLTYQESTEFKDELARLRSSMIKEKDLEGMCDVLKGRGYYVSSNNAFQSLTLYHGIKNKALDCDSVAAVLGPVAEEKGMDVKPVYHLWPYTTLAHVTLRHDDRLFDTIFCRYVKEEEILKCMQTPWAFKREFKSHQVFPLYSIAIHKILNEKVSDNAIACLKEAVRLEPESPQGYFLLGAVHMHNNRPDAAIRYISTAHRLAKENLYIAGLLMHYTYEHRPKQANAWLKEFNRLSKRWEKHPSVVVQTHRFLKKFVIRNPRGLEFMRFPEKSDS